jgi:hypothetical protein
VVNITKTLIGLDCTYSKEARVHRCFTWGLRYRAATALARGRRSLTRRREKVSASATRRRVAATAPAAPLAAARWSGSEWLCPCEAKSAGSGEVVRDEKKGEWRSGNYTLAHLQGFLIRLTNTISIQLAWWVECRVVHQFVCISRAGLILLEPDSWAD